MKKPGFVRFVALAATFALVTAIQPPNGANAVTACTLAQLEPQLGEFMVTQGVGGASGYSLLARGKETLAKVFMVQPASSLCTVGSGYIKITSASLAVTGGAVANTLFTNLGSSPTIPATTIQPESPADPIFVVPSANTAQGDGSTSFPATFTATITYSRKAQGSTTVQTGTKTFTTTKSFDRRTNALRVYVVPMGDASLQYSTQFTSQDQTIVQNAMQTLSRLYPTPAGVADLTDVTIPSRGVRYVVDTATVLNLKGLGTYVTANGSTKFCGTGVNFAAIKGLLAQYLLTHNQANPAATADRVVGVVGGNGSATGPISFGIDSTGVNCADGMASVSSSESWIRLIADGTTPSRSGALLGQEMTHTFTLAQTPSYHETADVEADFGTDRAYDVTGRKRIAFDHTVLNFNNTGSSWNNTNTLLEANDFSYLLCQFNGTPTACTSPANIGSSTGVAAGKKFVIAGTTDGTSSNTQVVEPYYDLDIAETSPSSSSLLRLLQLDTSFTPPHVVANFGMPWSPAVTHELGAPSPLRTFYAAAPGGFTLAGLTEVRLVQVLTAADLPPGSPVGGTEVTLWSTTKIDRPVITSINSNIPTSGGSSTLFRSQITPRIPPKPDIVFLADTTGSMTTALGDVRANAARIMGEVRQAQPDAWFAAASYKDEPRYCASDPYDFRVEQAITSDTSAVSSAITPTAVANSGWQTVAGQGCDIPEAQLNALYQLGATTVAGFRTDSSRIVVWFGDAIGHDPSEGHTLGAAADGDVIVALKTAGIRVIAVNITGSDGSLDQTGQASAIATATGGVVKQNNDYLVTQAILDGLHDLQATVTPVVNGDACSARLAVAFSPTSRTVPSGQNADFTETVTVAPGTTAGTYTCRVYFELNGKIVYKLVGESYVLDPAFIQDISIQVSDSQQQNVTVKATSTDPTRLLLDLIYACNSFNYVAAVAIAWTSISGAEATFNANADTSNACAPFGGGGTLVPYVSDRWNRVGGTVQSNTPSAAKTPTAAIYSPAVDAVVNWNSTLPLRGSGEIAGIELPASALSWSVVAPNSTTYMTFTRVSAVDVPAPSPDGWTPGTWTIFLTVSGSTLPASRTFVMGDRYRFLGFFSPVVNPPLVNTGIAGKTLSLKWSLTIAGAFVSDLSTVASTKYEPILVCGPQSGTTLADTSGQSTLRYSSVDNQFVFNWQTPSQPRMYLFRLTLLDGSTHDACVNLTAK